MKRVKDQWLQKLWQALHSSTPDENLLAQVRKMREEVSDQEIVRRLEYLRTKIMEPKKEEKDDMICEVLDVMYGGCHPDYRLKVLGGKNRHNLEELY